ncbi:MAG: Lrp/AsnC family transcriptional regulator [Chloroflexi bacterium]|nr:Lrp/AsnC family transcriptional regulator [Chloroflexota bacterium]
MPRRKIRRRRSRAAVIDDMDRKIAKLLHQDGRRSNAQLARLVGVSESTVRRKIQRMVGRKALRITAAPDLDAFGFPVSAVIGMDCDINDMKSVIKVLVGRPEVITLTKVTGPFDVLVWAALKSLKDLKDFIEDVVAPLPGVKQTQTMVVLDFPARNFGRIE